MHIGHEQSCLGFCWDSPRREMCCEYLVDPLGIDEPAPRLSWTLHSDGRDQRQTAYQVLVASSSALLDRDQGDLWDSGKVASDETAQVVYAGKPLGSRQACFWKVRVWDRDGQPSQWCKPARWEMGLLKADDWKARWITGSASDAEVLTSPVPILRKEIQLGDKPIASARLFATALGLYELRINGQRVGDHLFRPRLDRLSQARSLSGLRRYAAAEVGRQRDRGPAGQWLVLRPHRLRKWQWRQFSGIRQHPALLAQLEVTYADGSVERIVTDPPGRRTPAR